MHFWRYVVCSFSPFLCWSSIRDLWLFSTRGRDCKWMASMEKTGTTSILNLRQMVHRSFRTCWLLIYSMHGDTIFDFNREALHSTEPGVDAYPCKARNFNLAGACNHFAPLHHNMHARMYSLFVFMPNDSLLCIQKEILTSCGV